MVPSSKKKNLAMTKLSVNTTLARGIGFEMIFSFIYALVFFASTNSRLTFKGFGGPLAIGLFYGVSHVITVKVFGFSFFFFSALILLSLNYLTEDSKFQSHSGSNDKRHKVLDQLERYNCNCN